MFGKEPGAKRKGGFTQIIMEPPHPADTAALVGDLNKRTARSLEDKRRRFIASLMPMTQEQALWVLSSESEEELRALYYFAALDELSRGQPIVQTIEAALRY